MNIIADLHTHNGEVCGHADTTLDGIITRAVALKHCAVAITDHSPLVENTPVSYYLDNLKLKDKYKDITLLCGIEEDITDKSGKLYMDTADLLKLDWVIASFHCYSNESGMIESNTAGYLAALENPALDCLGHIDRNGHNADYEKVIQAVLEKGKTVEINELSFYGDHIGHEIAMLCKKYKLPIVLSSDSHTENNIGVFTRSINMLMELDFPKELVINADKDRLFDFINKRRIEKNKYI